MRCPSCAYENPSDAVYCGQCRAALTRPCPQCGEPTAIGAERCAACGTAFVPVPAYQAVAASPAPVAPPPPPPPAAAPPAAPRRSAQQDGTSFTGIARAFEQRGDRDSAKTVMSFRVERHDGQGNRLPPVPVELRGVTFSGSLTDGDEVSVSGKWKHGVLRVRRVSNLTTGAEIAGQSAGSWHRLRQAAVVVAGLGVVGLAAFLILTSFGSDDPQPRRRQPPVPTFQQ